MTTTIYFAENGWILDHLVLAAPGEETEPSMDDWVNLAGPGAVGIPPGVGPHAQPQQAPRTSRRREVILKRDQLLDDLRTSLSTNIPGQAAPVAPMSVLQDDPRFSSCEERIRAWRLDEGFLVVHTEPLRRKDLKEAVEVESGGKTKLGSVPAWTTDILKGIGSVTGRGGFGRTTPRAFRNVEDVVEFVASITKEDSKA